VDSRGVLGSSPGMSFWHLKSRALTGFDQGGSERETGGIRFEGDLRVDLEGSGLDPVILGFRVFT